jgi:hypothetical protein
MVSLFTILQQSWWALIMWLHYKLTMFCYFQFMAFMSELQLGTDDYSRCIRSHPFFQKLDWDALLEKRIRPPITPVIPKVSTKRFVFNCCHKGLSLKLHVKRESNRLVGSTLL